MRKISKPCHLSSQHKKMQKQLQQELQCGTINAEQSTLKAQDLFVHRKTGTILLSPASKGVMLLISPWGDGKGSLML